MRQLKIDEEECGKKDRKWLSLHNLRANAWTPWSYWFLFLLLGSLLAIVLQQLSKLVFYCEESYHKEDQCQSKLAKHNVEVLGLNSLNLCEELIAVNKNGMHKDSCDC